MNLRLRRNSRPASITRAVPVARPDLVWIHDGSRYSVSAWPTVRFEREIALGHWEECEPSLEAFGSAALAITPVQWNRYLDFVPASEREFLELFRFSRMAALHVITRCPALLGDLARTPALTVFLAAHLSLRGGTEPCWAEINAVFDRDGIFGVLQWLGLPASRQTVTILQNIADSDLAVRLLEPLRAALWEPEAIWALSHAERLTDARLAETCHALAA